MARIKMLAENRKARYDYSIEEKYEAGIALLGSEVKSIREGKASLRDSFARVKNNEIFLENVHIAPYSHGSYFNHEPLRARKLLMHKDEIRRLQGKVAERGYTLVPLRMYLNDKGKIKVELGLGRGKQKGDRRRDIMERETRRDMERMIKSASRRPRS
ncbi:MAG: SsrA-binding protein [Candidatus Solincola sediminis]|uniref:SsrA-binding protein n=1 Tax=Candidatus Solincola sediminis TaxID=1797199 RepID=A0A1F2WPJ7_9ACTN|nr:MAG: SsrA-binding protein [Candidatus Solincola sediminis]OFW58743.1 MAG: SsrA-binding protein [Candidatus Solincola sediminis]